MSTVSRLHTDVSSILNLGGGWWLGQALAPFSPQANNRIGPWPCLPVASVCSQLGRGSGCDGTSEMNFVFCFFFSDCKEWGGPSEAGLCGELTQSLGRDLPL